MVRAQWGAIADPPANSCGNHYHWDESKRREELFTYEVSNHLDFFRSDDYDHEKDAELHTDVHRHAKMAEEARMAEMLEEEKAGDKEAVVYGEYRAETEAKWAKFDNQRILHDARKSQLQSLGSRVRKQVKRQEARH